MTSAPRSASIMQAKGAGPKPSISITRKPSSMLFLACATSLRRQSHLMGSTRPDSGSGYTCDCQCRWPNAAADFAQHTSLSRQVADYQDISAQPHKCVRIPVSSIIHLMRSSFSCDRPLARVRKTASSMSTVRPAPDRQTSATPSDKPGDNSARAPRRAVQVHDRPAAACRRI